MPVLAVSPPAPGLAPLFITSRPPEAPRVKSDFPDRPQTAAHPPAVVRGAHWGKTSRAAAFLGRAVTHFKGQFGPKGLS